MSESQNGHASAEMCDKPGCGRPKKHTGRHTGQIGDTPTDKSERARKGAAARWAKARQVPTSALPALTAKKQQARVTVAAQTVEVEGVEFSIIYRDSETTFEKRGDSLSKCLAAMDALTTILKTPDAI